MADAMAAAAKVKLVVIGVDGVLTDAGLYFNEQGDMLRKFNRRDGMGIRLLQQNDIPSAIVSSMPSPVVERWAKFFGVESIQLNVRDKLHAIERLCIKYGIKMQNVAYISDDIDELGILERVGFPVTVADGMKTNKEASVFVTKLKGGEGAVRETIEMILYARFMSDAQDEHASS